MGGKTKFLYLRICCYFHLVPVCANFRFWFLCVCVCVLRDLFISVKAGDTFCVFFICSFVLTIRALCSDWSVVMSMIGVRTLSRHRFNANLVLKITSCTSVSMFPLNHFGSNQQKQNTYTFLGTTYVCWKQLWEVMKVLHDYRSLTKEEACGELIGTPCVQSADRLMDWPNPCLSCLIAEERHTDTHCRSFLSKFLCFLRTVPFAKY